MEHVISVSQIKEDAYNIIHKVSEEDEPVLVSGNGDSVIMMSQKYWSAIEERLHLKDEIENGSFNSFIGVLDRAFSTDDQKYNKIIK